MSDFDYTQYGTDQISGKAKEWVLLQIETLHCLVARSGVLDSEDTSINKETMIALCTALRTIDRLTEENEAYREEVQNWQDIYFEERNDKKEIARLEMELAELRASKEHPTEPSDA